MIADFFKIILANSPISQSAKERAHTIVQPLVLVLLLAGLLAPANVMAGAEIPVPQSRIYLPAIAHIQACGSAPCLMLPADGVTVDTLLPRLAWNAGEDPATVSHPCFTPDEPSNCGGYLPTEPFIKGAGVQFALPNHNLPAGQTVRWQVWATTHYFVDFLESPIWTIKTPANPPLLPAPVLIGPSGTVTETTVTFRWEPVAGAEIYRHCMQTPKGHDCEFTQQTQMTRTLSDGFDYDWWVEARNYYGYSPYNTLSVYVIP